MLFDEKDSKFDFTLVTADNRVVNTGDLYFTPVKGNDRNSITMRLNYGRRQPSGFMYTLKPDDYMLQFSIKGTGLKWCTVARYDCIGLVVATKNNPAGKGA